VLEEQRNVAQARPTSSECCEFQRNRSSIWIGDGLSLKKNNIEIDKTLGQVAVKITTRPAQYAHSSKKQKKPEEKTGSDG